MGPYCRYCDQRCFIHPSYVAERLPKELLEKLRAYSRHKFGFVDIPMLASCPKGKAFDKEEMGVCKDDFIAEARP